LIKLLKPASFILQWHITERCNWNCTHCYQNTFDYPDLPFNLLIKIFHQYVRFIKTINTIGPSYTRIQITGGEPLLRKDFFKLLEKIQKFKKYFSLFLLTNGSLITDKKAIWLKSLGIDGIQLSLEGMESKNDTIRGRGTFQKIIKAIEILVKRKIPVGISFTISKFNISDVPAVIDLCDKLGVTRLAIRRLVPLGRGERYNSQLLSPRELKKIYSYIEECNKKREWKSLKAISRGCEGGIFYQEIEEPLDTCGVVKGCVLTVLSNGDVVPCRRLPIRIGNIFNKNLLDIYYNSKILERLINLDNYDRVCKSCPYFDWCLSGARCVSFAYFKRLFAPDPQCWRIFEKLPLPDYYRNKKFKLSKRKKIHISLLLGIDGRV